MYWDYGDYMAGPPPVFPLVSNPQLHRCNICWYSFIYSILIVVLFLRHWWIRRKVLNSNWTTNAGLRSGISQGEFRRLGFTVMTVIFLYFPLSLVVLKNFLQIPMVPYSWEKIHGPLWGLIFKQALPRAIWPSWVPPALALTSFLFIGTTRNARRAYEGCVEW